MRLDLHVECSEVVEACAVFERWHGRRGELPQLLRDQLDGLVARPRHELVTVTRQGCQVTADLCPEARALVANLRAREG